MGPPGGIKVIFLSSEFIYPSILLDFQLPHAKFHIIFLLMSSSLLLVEIFSAFKKTV